VVVELYSGAKVVLYFNGRQHAGESVEDLYRLRSPGLPTPIQMADALACNWCGERERIVCKCLVHARRKFVEIRRIYREACDYVLKQIGKVYRNERQTAGLSDEERLAYHQKHSEPPGEEMTIPSMQVYPNSFATLGIPLVAGRDFGPQDNQVWIPSRVCPKSPATQVGIINESMARRFFGNESPIGRRFGFARPTTLCRDGTWSSGPDEIEIIGVVKDVKYTSLRSEGREMFYLPFYQAKERRGQMTLVVRTAGDPMSVAAAVRREAQALDPAMPMFEVEDSSHTSRGFVSAGAPPRDAD
jgi:Transposase IS66 family